MLSSFVCVFDYRDQPFLPKCRTMNTKIILLRGVMPTRKNKVPMAPLRAALEAAGLRNVRTYSINSIIVTGSGSITVR